MTRPAVFLDRDGTMNVDVGYLSRVEELQLFPYTIDAIRLLRRAGFAVVVVTNQGGIGRQMITEAFLHELHGSLARRLEASGAPIDGWYHCPHHPAALDPALRSDRCRCRKPEPGMIEAAVRDLDLDPSRSWVVGDKWLDVRLGHNVGARSVLVRTGWGSEEEAARPPGQRVEAICDTLADAVAHILRNSGT
jgi:D-glycero-D-manno-heptose 1,7-bisphosphate phosphatase